MERGGFDCVLGNPPWEKSVILEKEFFESRLTGLEPSMNKSQRSAVIDQQRQLNSLLYQEFEQAKKSAEATSAFIRSSNRYMLSNSGEANYYPSFFELFLDSSGSHGSIGIIVPTGIVADDSNKRIATYVGKSNRLSLFLDFFNKDPIFKGVSSNLSFCLLTLCSRESKLESSVFACKLRKTEDAADHSRLYIMTSFDLRLLSPNTGTFSVIASKEDKDIVVKLHRLNEYLSPDSLPEMSNKDSHWNPRFGNMFHMTGDSSMFYTEDVIHAAGGKIDPEEWVGSLNGAELHPLYESKLVDSYNHRYSTFEGVSQNHMYGTKPRTILASLANLNDSRWNPKPRYWVHSDEVDKRTPSDWDKPFLIGFRNAMSATADSRSFRATLLPRDGMGHSIQLLYPSATCIESLCLVGNLNSLILDYAVKNKVSGGNMKIYLVRQLPVIAKERYSSEELEYVASRVASLSRTSRLPLDELNFSSESKSRSSGSIMERHPKV